MSEGLISFCFTGFGATTSLVVVSVDVGDSLARVGFATGAATASSVTLCNYGRTFGVAIR